MCVPCITMLKMTRGYPYVDTIYTIVNKNNQILQNKTNSYQIRT